jgi:hypothetical protein
MVSEMLAIEFSVHLMVVQRSVMASIMTVMASSISSLMDLLLSCLVTAQLVSLVVVDLELGLASQDVLGVCQANNQTLRSATSLIMTAMGLSMKMYATAVVLAVLFLQSLVTTLMTTVTESLMKALQAVVKVRAVTKASA